MPITEAPPTLATETRPLRRDLPQDPAELHLFIEELEDERYRSRWRESIWISVILHLLLVIAIITAPKIAPDWFARDKVALVEPKLDDRDVQFLALPHDDQKVAPPKTSILSDKNRVAQARIPRPDRHTLEELQNARRQGPPGPKAVQAPPQPQVASAPPQPQQQGQQQAQNSGPKPADNSNTQAKLEQPEEARPNRNVFSTAGSAGSAIQQAARAAAAGHGAGGDYGIGPLSPNTDAQGAVDILSDTLGVDFGPYLARVLEDVRRNWYNLIPEEARSPLFKQGKLAIQFVIDKNGSVEGMRLVAPSGDIALDRAAWGGITASNPFPPLPKEFNGPYLTLRFRFYYNPQRGDIR
ncbi:MAG: TonB family protein [Acidobacteria bacterium]|nr:TonB family protein [Acidobacteriota bacterium]